MNTTYRKSNSDVTARPKTTDESNDIEKVSFLGIQLIMVIACIVGIWGFTCLMAGLNSTENFIELGANWIAAVLGI